MPLATPARYAEMLDAAKAGGYPFRAVDGDEHAYDPRTWSRSAEHAMAARVVEACHQLGSAATSLTSR